jgi:arylsulfatase A-like enzyme
VRPGTTSDAFVNLADLGPTFLDLAHSGTPRAMSARSMVPLLTGGAAEDRAEVYLERERHADVREDHLSYPVRAIRTAEFLYIRNLRPDRWPAGDPEMQFSVGPYGDCDNSPTKAFILNQSSSVYFTLAFARRPAEELYHLPSDPAQTNNVAGLPRFQSAREELSKKLDAWMRRTEDPRLDPKADPWSAYPYFGGAGPRPPRTDE